ncbi:hypothetical protein [Nostoc sp.]|uniref:hypothetical protein n=1 Tax=Nostoc sp. TaxID=1180 RepID=UPI002FF6D8D9
MNTLYQDTDNYLSSLQNFLEEQKALLKQGIIDDSDFELIITEANNLVIDKINDAIQSINVLRKQH